MSAPVSVTLSALTLSDHLSYIDGIIGGDSMSGVIKAVTDEQVNVLRELMDYVSKYVSKFGPLPLAIVNRRFGRQVREAFDVSVKTLLESRPDLFALELIRSGALAIVPVKLEMLHKTVIGELIECPVKHAELIENLRARGLSPSDVLVSIDHLREIGLVKVEGGFVTYLGDSVD